MKVYYLFFLILAACGNSNKDTQTSPPTTESQGQNSDNNPADGNTPGDNIPGDDPPVVIPPDNKLPVTEPPVSPPDADTTPHSPDGMRPKPNPGGSTMKTGIHPKTTPVDSMDIRQ